ncbi:uncharacterized protein N7498_005870 [Penicillium cinerascens]|uniref:RING-type domain-containing protein n=1 Tax=Penicillium cinerascens TaxID=70096 RepID=A0A9W9MPA3_9EURO|nr:uncharacterized protein N7498_005870 [Penicillium cinerascens]KAJ5204991.1 hypothetical protein N7498_005870 [Penicillium cinerascens]
MPSRESYIAGPTLPSLSEIIKLEPEKEPWCAGYAHSKGRRCHNPTNMRGRSSAMSLLDKGTKDLRAGRRIDTLLENLATYVLCTIFHQNQALDLACRWKRQVSSFLVPQATSQVNSATSERRVRRSSSDVYSDTAEANVDELCDILYRKLQDTLEELRRLQAVQHGPTISANSPVPRGDERASIDNNPRTGRSSTIRDGLRIVPSTRAVMRQSASSTHESTITAPRSTQVQVVIQARPASVSNQRAATVSATARVSSSTDSQEGVEATSQPRNRAIQATSVTRRAVEGECGICLCHMQTSQSLFVDESIEIDEEEDVENLGEEEDDEDEEDEELVWCRARCGVNFHKKCIDQWLETSHASTCPACRSTWRP